MSIQIITKYRQEFDGNTMVRQTASFQRSCIQLSCWIKYVIMTCMYVPFEKCYHVRKLIKYFHVIAPEFTYISTKTILYTTLTV